MKKIISIILAMLCVLLTLCSCNKPSNNDETTANPNITEAAVYTSGDYNYVKLSSDSVKIVKYNKKEFAANLSIPDRLDGLKVTVIGEGAFADSKAILNVYLPHHLTEIEPHAFDRSSLKNIDYRKSSVTTVESFTFCECDELVMVNFSDKVTELKDSAFYRGRMPRIMKFRIDPVISAKAIDVGRSYSELEFRHEGDISNYKKLADFADAFGIKMVLAE